MPPWGSVKTGQKKLGSRCKHCFAEVKYPNKPCPECEGSPLGMVPSSDALPLSTSLDNHSLTIGRVLGRGSYGITYLAMDNKSKHLRVVKEYFPRQYCRRQPGTTRVELADAVADARYWFDFLKERFVVEADVLDTLQHENIVLFKGRFEENETQYYVMEFCEGETLMASASQGSLLCTDDVIKYMTQVMGTLGFLHGLEHPIYHRDIKPDNILLTRKKKVKLLDFGAIKIGRLKSDANSSDAIEARTQNSRGPVNPLNFSSDTVDNQLLWAESPRTILIGTPGYRAPEQSKRDDKDSWADVGPWTDVYGCGATLYRLLTGRTPTDCVYRQSTRELDWSGVAVAQHVREAIELAMAIKIGERFRSTQDFIDHLHPRKHYPGWKSRLIATLEFALAKLVA